MRLVLDPIACDGRALCLELLPERIRADSWGFPILRAGPVPPPLLPLARRAVADCPRLALRLTAEPADGAAPGPGAAAPRPSASGAARRS